MKILFDQGTPLPLKRFLQEHEVRSAFELGWSELSNGDLLKAAIGESFDVLITTDKNIVHQQNLGGLNLAVLVLSTAQWPALQHQIDRVVEGLSDIRAGSITIIK